MIYQSLTRYPRHWSILFTTYFGIVTDSKALFHFQKLSHICSSDLKTHTRGIWVAQLIKHPTLDFSSDQIMISGTWNWAPHWAWSLFGILSPSSSPSLPPLLSRSLTLIKTKQNTYENVQEKIPTKRLFSINFYTTHIYL